MYFNICKKASSKEELKHSRVDVCGSIVINILNRVKKIYLHWSPPGYEMFAFMIWTASCEHAAPNGI